MTPFQRPPVKSVAVRPLTKGMFRDRATQSIEDGGMWTVRNAIVGTQGIYRRPAFYEIVEAAPGVTTPRSGLQTYYSFDAEDGTDDSGNGNGATVTDATVVDGVSGDAFHFDTSEPQYIEADAALDASAWDGISVSCWIKPDGVVSEDAFFVWSDISTEGFYLMQYQAGLYAEFYPYTADNYILVSTGLTTEWHHVALTYDHATTTARLYLNGVQIGTSTLPDGAMTRPNLAPFIGTWDTLSNGFGGAVDEVRIYNRVLTADEVDVLFTYPGNLAFTLTDDDGFAGHAIDARTWVQSSGAVKPLFVSDAGVYNLSKTAGLTYLPLEYNAGLATTADGVTITGVTNGSTPEWLETIAAGDYFVLDSDGTAVRISAVNSDTEIELEEAYPVTSFTGAAYTIYRTFRTQGTKYLVDSVVANNRAVFLSKYLPPIEVTLAGTAIEPLQAAAGDSTIASKPYYAVAGAFFQERLYLGNIREYNTGTTQYETYRQRIRWSTPTDFGNVTDTAYLDLDYTRGEILAIKPMGNLLVVYLSDAIYMGQGTPNTTLPLSFEQVETGGIGLVGQKAVVPYHDGHFYVGQDNIYFLSTRGRQAIGTPVVEETIRQCDNRWRVYAVADPKRNRVCFGFPGSSEYIEKVWSFDYRTQAWSYEEYPTWMIANPLFSGSLSWDDLTGTWDTLSATYPTWDDMRAETDDDRDFIREFEGALQQASDGATVDDVAGPVEVVLQSKNHDLGEPDLQKVWTRLALKIQFRREMVEFDIPLVFDVEVSYNAGRDWKGVGQLRVRAGADEGYCNFRLSSSHFMFRLTSASQVTPYWITEYTYTFAVVGEERRLGLQGV